MLPEPFHDLDASGFQGLSFEPGEHVFRQDDDCSGMFFVCDGHIELLRHSLTGERLVIHRAVSGETFAEASLFSEKYHCDAVAKSKSHLNKLDKSAVLNLFATNPDFASRLAHRFATQVQSYRRRLELLAVRSAEDRVHAALSEGLLSGTVLSFASEVGLTHEATYRALASLVHKGRASKVGRGDYRAID